MNHFLDTELKVGVGGGGVSIPDRRDVGRTNMWEGKGGIKEHVEVCVAKWGRRPGVVLVDFFERGEVVWAQDVMNGVG